MPNFIPEIGVCPKRHSAERSRGSPSKFEPLFPLFIYTCGRNKSMTILGLIDEDMETAVSYMNTDKAKMRGTASRARKLKN